MSEVSFKSEVLDMGGEAKQSSTVIDRIFEDVVKNDIRVSIQFTGRHTEIVNYIKSLGWNYKCLEWDYDFDNNIHLQVLSTHSGYTLTVSMGKLPIIKYPDRTFISAGALTWSVDGWRKFVLCRHCDNRIYYDDADLTYKGMESEGTNSYWCRCPECNRKFTVHELCTEDNKIPNSSPKEITQLPPDVNPFVYDVNTGMLTILNAINAKIRINTGGVVDLMNSISSIKGNRYKESDDTILNRAMNLRNSLKQEGYVKLQGPIDCEVWGVFDDDIENLLMLEIIYPDTDSRHINVALDLSKF